MFTDDQVREAYRVLDFVMAHPEQHDQDRWLAIPGDDWDPDSGEPARAVPEDFPARVTQETPLEFCGTTACFAGWTVLLAGCEVGHDLSVYRGGEHLGRIRSVARRALGLNEADAYRIFECAARVDLPRAIAYVFGPRPAGVPA